MDRGEDPSVCRMTSGDIARMLGVDPKTIHNWVRQGHLRGRRTKGGHLRFYRTDVVRFIRRFGYPIPVAIGEAVPRVMLVGASACHERVLRALGDSVAVQRYHCLFEASLVVASGDFEAIVIDLDHFEFAQVAEFIAALRGLAQTGGIAIVGVSRKADLREQVLGAGGDIAVAASTHLRATLGWLTGSSTTLVESEPARSTPVVELPAVAVR